MIAMPYILVNIVLGELSVLFFCITTAALLSTWPFANLWLPAPLRNQQLSVFLAHALALVVIARLIARMGSVSFTSPFIGDVLSSIALVNSIVLAYQFLDTRYFLNRPKVQRRLLLAICSVVMALVPFLAVVTAVVGLFVIR